MLASRRLNAAQDASFGTDSEEHLDTLDAEKQVTVSSSTLGGATKGRGPITQISAERQLGMLQHMSHEVNIRDDLRSQSN